MKRRMLGTVLAIYAERPGANEILVEVQIDSNLVAQRKALDLVELTGGVAVGDRVLLNTIAVEMGLGSGGLDFVVAVMRGEEPDAPPPGHIIKVRYTPSQLPVLAVEAQESPYHDDLRHFRSLQGLPVVCAQLHSQVPAIIAGARWAWAHVGKVRMPKVMYIMTDAAALPSGLSRLVAELSSIGWIDACITAGQAFGGDYEAVNTYSALSMAHLLGADLIVAGQGPGNVGTGTALGFSGIDQGQIVNAVSTLEGVPVVVPRISFADGRERHSGLSHHTVTVLERIALAPAVVPLPQLSERESEHLWAVLTRTKIPEKHVLCSVRADEALHGLIDAGLPVRTMGRGIEAERAYFLAACAAGITAIALRHDVHGIGDSGVPGKN